MSVIGACVKHGNMVEALRLKDEMVSCGKSVNVDLFYKMNENGLSPNKVTYALIDGYFILIDGYFRRGEIEYAFTVCNRMVAKNIVPSDFTNNNH